MEPTALYLHQVKKHYPDLVIHTVSLNQGGLYNDALIVNNEMVFRFAKVPAAVETLRLEINILQSLQGHLTLPIPNPIYQSMQTTSLGEAFLGYRMIPGIALTPNTLKSITDPDILERIASQIAGFLNELHHIPVSTVIPGEVPSGDTPAELLELYRRIREKLFDFMRPDARQQITQHFEAYWDHPDLYLFEPRLRHGDFGPTNILYDPDSASVVGIIDFGDARLGDPAVDFAGLMISYGIEFYERCARTYPEMESAMDRARFYYGTFALEEALFGIENGDLQAFHNGITEYI